MTYRYPPPPETLIDRGSRTGAHHILLGSHIYIESRLDPEEMGYVTHPRQPLSAPFFFPEGKYSKILSHYPQIVAVLNDKKSVESFLALPPRAQLKFFTAEPIVDKKTDSILGWKDKPAVTLGKTLMEADPSLSHWLAGIPYDEEPKEKKNPPPPPPPPPSGETGTPYELIPKFSHPDDDDDDDDDPNGFDFKP